MNFNFNFKDMPGGKEASIRIVTNACDLHHTGKTEERMDFAELLQSKKVHPKPQIATEPSSLPPAFVLHTNP